MTGRKFRVGRSQILDWTLWMTALLPAPDRWKGHYPISVRVTVEKM